MLRRSVMIVGVLPLLLSMIAGNARCEIRYTVTDLGTTGGRDSDAEGINSEGQIVGMADNGDERTHAFLYSNGVMSDIGVTTGAFSAAYCITDNGQIVGTARFAGLTSHASLYSNGTTSDLGTLGGPGSTAYSINVGGQVVGKAVTATGYEHAFLYTSEGMTDLGSLISPYASHAASINDSGRIVGWYNTTSAPTSYRAFLYSDGAFTDLGTLGGQVSKACDINVSGQIVGGASVGAYRGDTRAFLYSGGVMTDLGALDTGVSWAYAVNASGQAVGSAGVTGADDHACLFNNGAVLDLNTVIDTSSGWALEEAHDINDQGCIVGEGMINGVQHAFLLTPVPEPSTVVFVATVAVALLGWGWRRFTGR
jgi:probable HAF family extracellular repeat protein